MERVVQPGPEHENQLSLSLSLCAAAAVLASQLQAQIATDASLAPIQDDDALQSETITPWLNARETNALTKSITALQERLTGADAGAKPDGSQKAGDNPLTTTNRFLENFEAGGAEAFWLRSDSRMPLGQYGVAPESGGMLQSLLVNNHLLNVNFADNNKSGLAAIGQSASDYWNPYIKPGSYSWTILNLLWSDGITPSSADLSVLNAPGQWGSLFCVDPMYASYIYRYPSNGNITVTLNELPVDTYDFYVYATRASDNGAPVIQLKRAGVSLWTKGTTLWGNGWYSTYWDEHEQYVRFRNIAVNKQTITLELYPDLVGYPSISGLQIVPSSAIPSEQPTITALLNVDFGGNGTPYKSGLAAVGLTSSDFWNACYHPGNRAASIPNLKWSNQSESYAGLTVLNASGSWGNSLPDPMFRTYMYATGGGNTTITLTNLPSGICNVYLYGHTPTLDDNAVFELWSDEVNWGTKGTSIIGPGPTYATWEVGQQYVVFKDVTVTAGKPVIIHASHTKYGYNNLCGMQIAYTGAADTDADGLPDGWEQRCFNNLDQLATADVDADGLSNVREYQLGTDPTRTDSNANGIGDLHDFENVWLEDAVPQGGYQYSAGGDTWNWVSSWYDGSGWGGQVLYPHSGRSWDPRMHVSAKVLNAMHEHYFNRSLAVIRPAVGDVLYAYVNLDPSFPPTEVMLQFYTVENNGIGSWDHRAYWGANTINLGVNGTASRYPMGALPTAGQWVRLEVPASVVGLEGKIIAGLRFTLYGGRAAWDSAGTMKPDYDGDALPDWWEVLHFGDLLQVATPDQGVNWHYDADGISNLDEFSAGTDPNTIVFVADLDNDHVCSTSVSGTFQILAGVPSRMAILVDSTDFALANWVSYSSAFSCTVGATEGPHEVWIGLKGSAAGSEATWEMTPVVVDLTPATIVVTSPLPGSTLSRPLIQLQGYSVEPLTDLRYDVNNAGGLLEDLQAVVLDQYYDTNLHTFTTNSFQCFDVDLISGVNTVTLRATDLAGNKSTNSVSFTLDLAGDTTPPVVSIYWPQDGARVTGTSFTLRGFLDDPTAIVSAQITNANGSSNFITGIVERYGLMWIEDLPLEQGENTLTLTATDAAGNVTTTSIIVIQSTVGLTVDAVPADQLHQLTVNVTGTMNTSGYTVWVNGVEATDDGNGTWSATDVLLNDGNTAVIQARAIPNTDNGGHGTGGSGGQSATYANPGNPTSAAAVDRESGSQSRKQTRIYLKKHHVEWSTKFHGYYEYYANNNGTPGDLIYWADYDSVEEGSHDWEDGKGGTGSCTNHQVYADVYGTSINHCEASITWPRATWEDVKPGTWSVNGACTAPRFPENPPCMPMEHCEVKNPPRVVTEPLTIVADLNSPYFGCFMSATIRTESFRTADATVKVFTGDKSIAHPNRQSILELYVPVSGVADKSIVCGVQPNSSVRPETVTVGELGRVNFDYTIYAVKPRGETIDATVHAPPKRYVWAPSGNMHDLAVQCVCTGPNDRERTTVGVGEQVNLTFEPALDFHNPLWGHAGGGLSTSPTVPANGTLYTASSNATTDRVMANFPKGGGGYVTLTTEFSVLAPTGIKATVRGLPDLFDPPYPKVGAGMQMDVVLQPTTVSFKRVQIMEPGEPTTATGYFTQITPPSHANWGANVWHPVECNNKVTSGEFDHVKDAFNWPIGVSGTYTWPIHPVWRVGAADTTTDPLSGWTEQKFTLSTDGTMRIDKLLHNVIRGPNQPRGTAQ